MLGVVAVEGQLDERRGGAGVEEEVGALQGAQAVDGDGDLVVQR